MEQVLIKILCASLSRTELEQRQTTHRLNATIMSKVSLDRVTQFLEKVGPNMGTGTDS
jgi:hypothetical protein